MLRDFFRANHCAAVSPGKPSNRSSHIQPIKESHRSAHEQNHPQRAGRQTYAHPIRRWNDPKDIQVSDVKAPWPHELDVN